MAKPKRLGDKKYMIVYDVPPRNGKTRQQKRETLSGVTRGEAEAVLARRIERAKIHGCVDEPGLSMSEVFDKFIAAKKKRLEATSLDRYESLISTYLRPELGAICVASLRKANLLEAYEAWQARKRRPSARTIHHAHDLLRAILNWAVSLDYVENNAARKITAEDLPKALKPENAVLDEGELRALLAEAQRPTSRAIKRCTLSSEPWFHPAVAFAGYTGARRGEVLAVKWPDLDLDVGTVTIRESLSEPRSGLAFKRPKNGKIRTLTMGSELTIILRTHKAKQAEERLFFGEAYKKGDLVFARPDGGLVTPWNFGAAFKDLVARAGVTPITLHDLRDTHASLLAKAGVPIEVISNRLGHSCINVTVDRYLTVYRDRDAAAAAAFERLVA
jgi:integrase